MAIKGIDVSEHQGRIDWEKVKADGIKFAILRCGFGMDITRQDDSEFERNMKECERLGIPFGVYLFSYANTVEKAKSEAEHTLRLIKGHKLALGVWYDIEDNNTSGKVSKSMLTNIITKYCGTIKNAGFYVGVYASLSWLNNKIDKQIKNEFPIWVAQYYSKCEYSGKYVLWQYSSNGKVAGTNGNIDMNYLYDEGLLKETSSNAKPSTKKKYTGTFPKLPSRGYFYYNDKTVTDKGTEVKNLQKLLNWAVNAKLTVDGYLGPATKNAILLFQKTYKLTQDGCFGPACLAKAKTITK